MTKLSPTQIIYTALVWAEESMAQMVDGCGPDDEYGKKTADKLKQLRAYRHKRFGKHKDPFKDAKLVDIYDLAKEEPSKP